MSLPRLASVPFFPSIAFDRVHLPRKDLSLRTSFARLTKNWTEEEEAKMKIELLTHHVSIGERGRDTKKKAMAFFNSFFPFGCPK